MTPPAITVDPDPFALKVDPVHKLDDIKGLVTLEDTEGEDRLIVHGSEGSSTLPSSW